MSLDPNKTYLQWNGTTFPNSSAAQFKAPAGSSIDWGDGVVETFDTASTTVNTHTYTDGKTEHTIAISGLTSIGSSAFESCSGLTGITIPDSVTNIGIAAFRICRNLTRVDISNLSAWCKIQFENYLSNPLYYAKKLYLNNELVTNLAIPDSVTSIGGYAFESCSGLTNVTIPNSVTSIGPRAFNGCSGLTSINIPDSVTSIGNLAFKGCSELTSVTIPDSVTSIGLEAFNDTAYYNNASNWQDDVLYIGKHLITAKSALSGDCVIKNGTLTIADDAFYKCIYLTSITIPDSVTSIGRSAFAMCKALTSVVIPDNVTSIGDFVFSDCKKLTSVTIPYNVTSIGGYAFQNCSGLTSITIPNGVTSIGNAAFYGCSGLTSVTIGNGVTSIGNDAFHGCSSLTSIAIPDSVTSIGVYAFEYCNKLVEVINQSALPITKGSSDYGYVAYYALTVKQSGTTDIVNQDGYLFYPYEGTNYLLGYSGNETDLVLPDSYNGNSYQIYEYAFYNCSGLTSITIPNGVTSIGERAFQSCGGLTNVTIGNGVTSIGSNAFESCSGLTGITIPDSVTNIGDYAFYYCRGLTSVTIPDSVTSIGSYAFKYTAYYNNASNWQDDVLYIGKHLINAKTSLSNNYEIKSGTLTIADNAFNNCSSLANVTIPDSVTSIGNFAFSTCSGLSSVTIGNGVTSIGERAFQICSGLTSVTIPDSVTSIGSYAFSRCSGLTSITIPNGVTSIGERAFQSCGGLTNVTIGNGVTSIGSNAFESCSGLTGVYINDLSAWCKIEFKDSYSNPLYYAKNLYLNNELVTDLVIPDSVTSINNYAFYNCSSIANVTIPDSVMSIGKSAFYNTAYYNNESNWQDNVLYIGKHLITAKSTFSGDCVIKNSTLIIADYAFSRCSGLTSVTIPDSVTSIGDCAFYKCSGLTSITLPFVGAKKDATNITYFGYIFGAPSSSDNSSYVPSSLKTVIITGGTSIRNSAFYNCSGLTSITIPNSVTSIRNSAFYNCSGLTSVTIPDSVTSIERSAFEYCTGLKSITIPDSVTSIGVYAFEGCSSLKQLILFPSTPPTLGTSAIPTTISTIYVQQSSKAAYQAATNWIAFASKIVSDNLYLSFARFNQKNKEYINTAIVNAITKSLNTAV